MRNSAPAYWEERLRANWGLQGVGHIGYGVRYNRWLYKVRHQIGRRELSRLPLNWNQAEVLDVGSGTGFWVQIWREVGAELITASDLTDVAVRELRQQYPELSVLKLDISGDIQRVHKSFDVISSFDVLFHITDDDAYLEAMSNVSRLLKPGGYFVFSDNFLHGEEIRSEHQVSRSLDATVKLLSQLGFRVLRRVPMFILMNKPVDTRSAWIGRIWRSFMVPVRTMPLLGSLYGSILYPLELLLTRMLKESPTTELMICQKEQ